MFHTGIRVEAVEKKSLAIPLSLPGRVSFNERRQAMVTARVAGRVETLNVFTNDEVKTGQVLLELYSQEYLVMQNELLQAADRLKRGPGNGDTTIARALYESARRKLEVAGLPEARLDHIENEQEPESHLHVLAPFNGTIIKSNVRSGMYVEAGTELFEIADLSTLWVLADLFEKDLPHVREEMPATVEVSAYRNGFRGTISSIYGVLDGNTRTVKARVEVTNTARRLKPEMFCTVLVQTRLGDTTVKIPAGALLGETEEHFVFVALNDTTFEKRAIRTGVETREFAEVLEGLLEGERIVVKGAFFLKSELARETFGEEH
jgi:RND family efflux transporter MFP subunit